MKQNKQETEWFVYMFLFYEIQVNKRKGPNEAKQEMEPFVQM